MKTNSAPQADAKVERSVSAAVPAAAMGARLGNQSMLQVLRTRLSVQPKLDVSDPADPYEREADSVADRVMRMPAEAPAVQRKCAACEDELMRTAAAPSHANTAP